MLYLIDTNNIKFIVYKIIIIYIYFTLIYTKCIRIILLISRTYSYNNSILISKY